MRPLLEFSCCQSQCLLAARQSAPGAWTTASCPLRLQLWISQLQVKSLGLGSAGAFLQRAPEAPEPRAVEHALDTLRTMGALNEAEDLTSLGTDLHIGIG